MKLFQIENIVRGDEQPYLWRLIIFRCHWFSIMLHVFQDSDDDCLHDHPWDFVSIILLGGYYERDGDNKLTWYSAGSILRRKADWKHQVVLHKKQKAVTLIITTGKKRSWGFWSPIGWIAWFRYPKSGSLC